MFFLSTIKTFTKNTIHLANKKISILGDKQQQTHKAFSKFSHTFN